MHGTRCLISFCMYEFDAFFHTKAFFSTTSKDQQKKKKKKRNYKLISLHVGKLIVNLLIEEGSPLAGKGRLKSLLNKSTNYIITGQLIATIRKAPRYSQKEKETNLASWSPYPDQLPSNNFELPQR